MIAAPMFHYSQLFDYSNYSNIEFDNGVLQWQQLKIPFVSKLPFVSKSSFQLAAVVAILRGWFSLRWCTPIGFIVVKMIHNVGQ
mmetsp:Transcript_17712/g.26828  ORF Transcript_17712/g.26828 Transcript_17712/m.26828 type:complete len:84 (-) Transcript_17712:10-261(-)